MTKRERSINHDAVRLYLRRIFKDTVVYITFMYTTVNSRSAVSITNVKSGLVGKQDRFPFFELIQPLSDPLHAVTSYRLSCNHCKVFCS